MHPTGTHIAYYHLCHRKLWLFAHGIHMEHTSDLVREGKLIEETSYRQRAERWRELAVEGIKIDHYDAQKGIVREVKKSNHRENAHIAQVKYYLYMLMQNGIKVDHGMLEYPKLRITEKVLFEEEDTYRIEQWLQQIKRIIEDEHCPPILVNNRLCKRCAYYEFCYSGETEKS
jgi:CRISPR-associated exonuclease Cas4